MNDQEKIIQLLEQARTYVEDGWTRYALARNKAGKPVGPCSPQACRWCASGALYRAAVLTGGMRETVDAYMRAEHFLKLYATSWHMITTTNNHAKSKAEVLRWFATAIEAAKKETTG